MRCQRQIRVGSQSEAGKSPRDEAASHTHTQSMSATKQTLHKQRFASVGQAEEKDEVRHPVQH